MALLRSIVQLYLLCHSIDVLRLPLQILDVALAVLIVLLGLARALFVLRGHFLDLAGVRQDELIVLLKQLELLILCHHFRLGLFSWLRLFRGRIIDLKVFLIINSSSIFLFLFLLDIEFRLKVLLDHIELHVIVDVSESILCVLQILIGYNLMFPEAVCQGLSHELSVSSSHHDQSVVDSFLTSWNLFRVKLFSILFFDLSILDRLDVSYSKLVANGHRWSSAWVLEKTDRVVVLTQMIADMQSGYRPPGEVAKCHTWVVNLMNKVIELVGYTQCLKF